MTINQPMIVRLSGAVIRTGIAVCLLIIGDGIVPTAAHASPDDDAPALEGVRLAEKMQQRAGLETTTLKSVQYVPEFTAYGTALSIQPLLNLRNRYRDAQAANESAQAKLALAQQNLNRVQDLHRNGIVSKRTLQEQLSQLRVEKAQAQALQLQIKTVYEEALLSWGQTLADLFLSDAGTRLTPFLTTRKTLLLIALPPDKTLSADIESIAISPSGERSKTYPAEFISIAPQTDAVTQGESYFFATDHAAIRTGMRISAWVPQRQNPESGVLIPASALIWHLGQAFVYLKIGAERFIRRHINGFIHTRDGYFIQGDVAPGEKLVTTGAQMLLSEEFRGQIPDEDDD